MRCGSARCGAVRSEVTSEDSLLRVWPGLAQLRPSISLRPDSPRPSPLVSSRLGSSSLPLPPSPFSFSLAADPKRTGQDRGHTHHLWMRLLCVVFLRGKGRTTPIRFIGSSLRTHRYVMRDSESRAMFRCIRGANRVFRVRAGKKSTPKS